MYNKIAQTRPTPERVAQVLESQRAQRLKDHVTTIAQAGQMYQQAVNKSGSHIAITVRQEAMGEQELVGRGGFKMLRSALLRTMGIDNADQYLVGMLQKNTPFASQSTRTIMQNQLMVTQHMKKMSKAITAGPPIVPSDDSESEDEEAVEARQREAAGVQSQVPPPSTLEPPMPKVVPPRMQEEQGDVIMEVDQVAPLLEAGSSAGGAGETVPPGSESSPPAMEVDAPMPWVDVDVQFQDMCMGQDSTNVEPIQCATMAPTNTQLWAKDVKEPGGAVSSGGAAASTEQITTSFMVGRGVEELPDYDGDTVMGRISQEHLRHHVPRVSEDEEADINSVALEKTLLNVSMSTSTSDHILTDLSRWSF